MTECNAIIEANNEIDELKRENKKLNKSCVRYGFEVGRLEEENERMRQFITKGKRLSVKELMENTNENELLKKKIRGLEKENEQLRKQIQNYKQLIANSYVGEEETLDGFVGKYVIWENELQKYKNKNEMIDNG